MTYHQAVNEDRRVKERCAVCTTKDEACRIREPEDGNLRYHWSTRYGAWESTGGQLWNDERQIWEDKYVPRRDAGRLTCETEEIRPFCRRGDMIILNQTPFYYRKLVKWPWVALALSYVVALFLIRRPNGEWPAYTLASLSIVHLYALVLSKGAAIRNVAIATTLVVLGWAAWLIFPNSHGTGAELWRWGPIAVWVICIVHALLLGVRAQPANRHFSCVFLVMGVFILGMWGVLAIDLRYGLGYGFIANLALPIAALIPLVVIVTDVLRVERGDRWQDTAAPLVLTLSIYLTVLQIVAGTLRQAEERMATKLLGLPVAHLPNPSWFALLHLKFLFSAIVFLIAFMIRVTSSSEQAAQDLWTPQAEALKHQIDDSYTRISQDASNPRMGSLIVEHVRNAFLHCLLLLHLSALLIKRILQLVGTQLVGDLVRIATAIVPALRRFALPVASFSIVALLQLAVVRTIVGYATGTVHAYAGPTLWGGLVCATAVVLLLCVGSFGGLSPATEVADADTERTGDTPSVLLSGLGPAASMMLLFWPALTLLGLAAWPLGSALTEVGVHGAALGFGPLLLINLGVVAFATLVSAIGVLQPGELSGHSFVLRKFNDDISMAILLGVLAIIGGFAIFLGHGPMINWFDTFT